MLLKKHAASSHPPFSDPLFQVCDIKQSKCNKVTEQHTHTSGHTHTHTCSRSVMRVSVAYIGHIAVSSPSLALGGLSCPAELQRAQGTKDGVCSPVPLRPLRYFFNRSPSFCKKDLRESVSGGSKGGVSKAPTPAEWKYTSLK